ncbi:hypothetical protein LTR78_002317 [Recurvomyces mirabilis]|uniref:Uncharacterized protein n=1 Tax=Recurvomyces mirabilis TaxID=574656 RepID=A0AAE0WU79_9PEZI|nr:hypothetical protein LTR78_002317 [Recurvomyces mirabilis]KAK5160772.1 hypothetical protein LTS14_001785 [Recurvomyces mirabilis]
MYQPPAKRAKTGPVITRYLPPPGYRGPATQSTWTPPPYQAYPPAPTYQPTWPVYPQQSYVANGYPAYAPGWQQQPTPVGNPPQSINSYPWQANSAQHNPNKRRHSSIPPAHSRHTSIAVPLDGNGDPLPAQTVTDNDDLEHEFDAECYYARHPDEVDPNLSLGLIEWNAPKPTNHPLAGSFAEAEVEVIAPRRPRAADEPSISDYFTNPRLEESLRSVRQTTAWQEIKDDLIYRQFSRVCKEVIRMSELMSRYRDRPDPAWEAAEDGAELHDSIMEMDEGIGCVKSTEQAEEADILGNLEQALTADNVKRLPNSKRPAVGSRTHSRATSVASTAGERITRPRLLEPIRDSAQEDVLASLGVTGSPKVVYQTPGPALGPGSQAASSRQGSVVSDDGHARQQPASRGSSYRENDIDATPRASRYYERGGESSRKRSYGDYYEDRRYDDRTPRPRYKQQRVDRAYE